jgi:hypothetical protein
MLGVSTRKCVLNGTLCTIHFTLAGASAAQFTQLLQGTIESDREKLELRLRESLREAFGPNLRVGRLSLNSKASEILVEINANSYSIKNSANFEKALTRFVFHLQDLLNEEVRDKLGRAFFKGQWFPAPPLIRILSDPPEKYVSLLKRVQQPLIMLLLGTVLGSALIPWIQSRSNMKRVRHQERIKLALEIIDQNRRTNSKLVGLRTALELFAKDHASPQPTAKMATQQEDMLQHYNAQYLSFNEQAWWWYWGVQMKAQLTTLATPEEAVKIQNLASLYNTKLQQCVADLDDSWEKLLRQKYDPRNWNSRTNQELLDRARLSLDKHNSERDQLALQMSEVFASEPERSGNWISTIWKQVSEVL